MKISKQTITFGAITIYLLFIISSLFMGFKPGQQIGHNFLAFALDMLKVLPCAFILLGLFDVWVKKETIEKHLGQESNILGYIWMILLAGTTVGGLYVAFPVAYSLFKKGARLSCIFTYIGAAAVCRIPMLIFEASFMGIKFSIIRLLVSMPLIILTAIWLGNWLEKQHYQITEGHNN